MDHAKLAINHLVVTGAALKVFEQPLNERVRACLRLEHLFSRSDYYSGSDNAEGSLCAILMLLEIGEVLGRIDLKRELMKELERQSGNLQRLLDSPGIDQQMLRRLLDRQKALIDGLHEIKGQPGAHLKNHELLAAVKQRAAIPGGLCDFDIAPLHYWLKRPADDRHQDLEDWIMPFEVIRESNALILELIRNSVSPLRVVAENGFLQQSMDPGAPLQMLRVRLEPGTDCYPEISAGKHRFSVRFMRLDPRNGHPLQVDQDIPFQLSTCQL
ncbi:MAG: cell division protein ZapD [Halothiobacillaceae bacterium]